MKRCLILASKMSFQVRIHSRRTEFVENNGPLADLHI